MIKTILLASDGSEHAKKALKLASDIAAKYNARLVILHVLLTQAGAETLRAVARRSALSKALRYQLDNYEADAMAAMAGAGEAAAFVILPAPRELLEAIARQIVDHAEAQAGKAGVKKIVRVVAEGDPADLILQCAAQEKADMIVLGSRGLGDFKGLLLGSVSHKVSARAACTCVTVK